MNNTHEIIEKSIEKILNLMDFTASCSIKEKLDAQTDKKTYTCSIKTESDSRFLIGQRGANLYALEHVLRSILYRNDISDRVSIDINGYKADKDRLLVNIAKESADQAFREKKPVVLRPMNGYERRIIHMTVCDDTRVETESIGEGEERKVVIKPQSIMESL